MKTRLLGRSDLELPIVSLGTATFGGGNAFFAKWGMTDVKGASALISAALELGCNSFDTADSYSNGLSEEILGKAISGRRDKVVLATKTGMRMGPGDVGTSAARIRRACEESLRRLGTDYIDLYHLHAYDPTADMDELLDELSRLAREGKLREFGVSNYSGWHLMNMLARADSLKSLRPVAHQAYYSLLDREFEWELMPLGAQEDVSTLVWSPLAGAQLTGKVGRNKPLPAGSRAATDAAKVSDQARLYKITDELELLSGELGLSIPRIALAWVLARPTVASVIIGANTIEQLQENLLSADTELPKEAVTRLNVASEVRPIYPYWHQRATFSELNPPLC